jgi:DNA replication initiation complex subunit (GINS family)
MIQYSDLEKAYRTERNAPTLQKLQSAFYEEARELAANPDVGDFRDKVREYLGQVYTLRANKIIHYAGRADLNTKPPENILAEEMTLYLRMVEAVSETRAAILDKKVEHAVEAKKPTVRVRLLQALPAIAGSDNREYGPFKEDDVVELPEDNAAVLMERKIADKA